MLPVVKGHALVTYQHFVACKKFLIEKIPFLYEHGLANGNCLYSNILPEMKIISLLTSFPPKDNNILFTPKQKQKNNIL